MLGPQSGAELQDQWLLILEALMKSTATEQGRYLWGVLVQPTMEQVRCFEGTGAANNEAG